MESRRLRSIFFLAYLFGATADSQVLRFSYSIDQSTSEWKPLFSITAERSSTGSWDFPGKASFEFDNIALRCIETGATTDNYLLVKVDDGTSSVQTAIKQVSIDAVQKYMHCT